MINRLLTNLGLNMCQDNEYILNEEVKEVKQFEEQTVNAYTGTFKDSCYQEIDKNIVDKDLQCQVGLGIIIE